MYTDHYDTLSTALTFKSPYSNNHQVQVLLLVVFQKPHFSFLQAILYIYRTTRPSTELQYDERQDLCTSWASFNITEWLSKNYRLVGRSMEMSFSSSSILSLYRSMHVQGKNATKKTKRKFDVVLVWSVVGFFERRIPSVLGYVWREGRRWRLLERTFDKTFWVYYIIEL